jgi:hypothetical protein
MFGSGAGMTLTLDGPLLTGGTLYTVSYTKNGSSLGTPAQIMASSIPGSVELDVPTPFSNLVLAVDDIIGIVVSR